MDLNHRSTGYEPVGLTMLTYPASAPSATVSILEPTDTNLGVVIREVFGQGPSSIE